MVENATYTLKQKDFILDLDIYILNILYNMCKIRNKEVYQQILSISKHRYKTMIRSII